MTDIYTPQKEKSDFSKKFTLITHIESVTTGYGSDTQNQYAPVTETYRMDNETFKFTVDAIDTDDDMPMFTEKELPISEHQDYMESENNEEFIRLLERRKKSKRDISDNLNSDNYKKIDAYLSEVYRKFEDWYRKNNITRPDSIYFRDNLENLISDCIDEVVTGNTAIQYNTDEERKELTDYLFRQCEERFTSHVSDTLKAKLINNKKLSFDEYDFEDVRKRI